MNRPPSVASSVTNEDHSKEHNQGLTELEKPAKDPQKDATLISKLFFW